jgi:hypothetical protein
MTRLALDIETIPIGGASSPRQAPMVMDRKAASVFRFPIQNHLRLLKNYFGDSRRTKNQQLTACVLG